MSKIVLTLFLVFFSAKSYSQLNKWLVRTVTFQVRLIDFSTPTPSITTPSVGYGTGGQEDVNVMTDVNGKILFTSAVSGSFNEIRDSNFAVMPNGSGLITDPSSLESGVVRIPCSMNKYYFIHFEGGGSGNLYYSIVDMALNSGLGDVVNKNTLIGSGYSEGVAISHQTKKGCRWLLVAHINGNTYQVTRFLINDAGISSPTVIASITLSSGLFSPHDIDFSPDNSKLIMSTWCVNPIDPDIVTWDFDLENGTVTNQQNFSVSNQKILGIESSPNSQWVYFIDNASVGGVKCGRVNITNGTLEIISNSIGQYSANIGLAGNGKIYFMESYTNGYLSEIANPDSPTLAGIGFTPNMLLINTGGCRPAIPNAIEGEPPGTTVTPQYIAFSEQPTANCNEFQFIDSTCLATWWEWDFGDGNFSNQQNPVHQYTSSGIFTVKHRVVSCGDTLTLIKNNLITSVPANVLSQFTTADSLCFGTQSTFTNTSTGASTYLWNFGDGDTSSSNNLVLSHLYQNAGTFNVTLVASNNCGIDTFLYTIAVVDTPAISFTDSSSDCGLTVLFDNNSTGFSNFIWSFGDGQFDSLTINPAHTYITASSYSVTLFLVNSFSCSSTMTKNIITQNPPQADYLVDVKSCESKVYFIDSSQYAQSYFWSFGDGSFSSVKNPEHSYLDSGYYAVTLFINRGTVCEDSIRKTIYIEVPGPNSFYVPNTFTPNSDSRNETFEIMGNFSCNDYLLQIFGRWGTKIFESDNPAYTWDGTYKNHPVPDGVYVYLFRSGTFTKRGTVSLIR